MPTVDAKDNPPEPELEPDLERVAAELGLPLAALLQLPPQEIVLLLLRQTDQVRAETRALAAEGRALARDVQIKENLITVAKGQFAGLISVGDAIRAMDVTDAEVDAVLAAIDQERLAEVPDDPD